MVRSISNARRYSFGEQRIEFDPEQALRSSKKSSGQRVSSRELVEDDDQETQSQNAENDSDKRRDGLDEASVPVPPSSGDNGRIGHLRNRSQTRGKFKMKGTRLSWGFILSSSLNLLEIQSV